MKLSIFLLQIDSLSKKIESKLKNKQKFDAQMKATRVGIVFSCNEVGFYNRF